MPVRILFYFMNLSIGEIVNPWFFKAGLSLNLTVSIPVWVSDVDPNTSTTEGFNYAYATAGILPETGSEWVIKNHPLVLCFSLLYLLFF